MNRSTNDNTPSESRKPLLLLDVDGVLNAFPDSDASSFTRRAIDGYPIHFHHEVRQMVSALDEAFEILWFTLWNHRAAIGIGPHVGLSDKDHLTTSWEQGWDAAYSAGCTVRTINEMVYAKTPLLPAQVGTDRHWVWIDDAHGATDHDYLVEAGFDPRRFRLVRTDPEVGLTWTDVNRALEFAQAVADGVELPADDSVDASATGTSAQGPGSTAGRVDAVTTDASTPPPDDRDDVDAVFRELMASFGDDGSEVCARCGGLMRQVVYGFPSSELFQDADKGEVVLGGCCIPSTPAQSRCTSCGHEVPRYRLGADLEGGITSE